MMRIFRPGYAAMLLLMASWQLHAVTTPPKEHIHFMAEHLAEGAQDALYYAMPWPTGDYSSRNWQPLVSVGGAVVDEGFVSANGQLLALGLSHNWSDSWATQLVLFYDRFHIGGSQATNALLPYSVNGLPLDLPETAIFSSPDGEFTHSGFGLIVSHQLNFIHHVNWKWDALAGVLVEKFEMNNFTFEYELTGGLDAGTTGILDHSGDVRFLYYVIGVQARKSVADHYTITPRFIYGRPRQPADLLTRITGPGFDLSTESSGADPGRIGDQFGYFGMTVSDRHSGLEMDIGALLGYATYEYIAHEGINTALIISLTWRM